MKSVNLLRVCIAALSAFVLGFLIHRPVAGELWMKLANIHPTGNENFKDMLPQMYTPGHFRKLALAFQHFYQAVSKKI